MIYGIIFAHIRWDIPPFSQPARKILGSSWFSHTSIEDLAAAYIVGLLDGHQILSHDDLLTPMDPNTSPERRLVPLNLTPQVSETTAEFTHRALNNTTALGFA